MRYKLFGPPGLRVSELLLRTMTFGEDWGWGAPPEECRRMLDAYAEAGGSELVNVVLVETSLMVDQRLLHSADAETPARPTNHLAVCDRRGPGQHFVVSIG
jgi:hypothetical protein